MRHAEHKHTRTKKPKGPSIAEQYITDVIDSNIMVSNSVRLACIRQQHDLETGSSRGIRFDRDKAQRVIDFIEKFCRHSQGEWAGQPMKLEPWQQAMLWILYGWVNVETGYRRFRYAYTEMAKGNGKSFLSSCIGLYEMVASGEPGSEVYSVATKKDQARIVFNEAERIVKQSPSLKKRIKNFRDNLHVPGTASKFQPLSSDEDSLDGPRPQCIIVDELHAWGPSGRKLWDVLSNALGKRRSPLFFVITTAGSDRHSVCYQQHEYSEKVLSSVIEDDTWFAWIAGLDPEDRYDDPNVWIKANPNLGVSVRVAELSSQITKAMNDPASLNGVLRLRLGVWTQSQTAWMPHDAWAACSFPVDAEKLKHRPCFGGLDLSTTTDISALVLLFPPVDGDPKWSVLPYFFLPEENIEKRVKTDRVPYDAWQRMGLFNLTPGNVIDYSHIRAKILSLKDQYDIREIAFDPWNATQIVTQLMEDGLMMVKVRQGYETLSAPTKRLMELVLSKDLAHGGNPILKWMAANVMVKLDPAGNQKPDKASSREKIDGIVALVMALARANVVPVEPKRVSFVPFVL